MTLYYLMILDLGPGHLLRLIKESRRIDTWIKMIFRIGRSVKCGPQGLDELLIQILELTCLNVTIPKNRVAEKRKNNFL